MREPVEQPTAAFEEYRYMADHNSWLTLESKVRGTIQCTGWWGEVHAHVQSHETKSISIVLIAFPVAGSQSLPLGQRQAIQHHGQVQFTPMSHVKSLVLVKL